jgi:hypothetical protein
VNNDPHPEINRGLLRGAIYDGIRETIFEAVVVDGEEVRTTYGKLWDACNEAAELLMNGKAPQLGRPDEPYLSALKLPSGASQ